MNLDKEICQNLIFFYIWTYYEATGYNTFGRREVLITLPTLLACSPTNEGIWKRDSCPKYPHPRQKEVFTITASLPVLGIVEEIHNFTQNKDDFHIIAVGEPMSFTVFQYSYKNGLRPTKILFEVIHSYKIYKYERHQTSKSVMFRS